MRRLTQIVLLLLVLLFFLAVLLFMASNAELVTLDFVFIDQPLEMRLGFLLVLAFASGLALGGLLLKLASWTKFLRRSPKL